MDVLTLHIPQGGRCFVVGDVSGHFSDLLRLVNQVELNPSRDRLVLNGNFLGFTPSSRQASAWIEKPWVIPLLGRHEACILQSLKGETAPSLAGQWVDLLSMQERALWVELLEGVPVALEARTDDIHVVVSHCPLSHATSWEAQREALSSWTGTPDKVFSLFDGRLLGLGATGKLATQFRYDSPGEPLSLSSFHVERPATPLLRKGRYAFLVGSAHMRHGNRYSHPCLLPYVELTTLDQSNTGETVCHGSLDIRAR